MLDHFVTIIHFISSFLFNGECYSVMIINIPRTKHYGFWHKSESLRRFHIFLILSSRKGRTVIALREMWNTKIREKERKNWLEHVLVRGSRILSVSLTCPPFFLITEPARTFVLQLGGLVETHPSTSYLSIPRNDTLLFLYFPPLEWTMLFEVAATTAASAAAIKRKANGRRRKDEKVAPPTIFYSLEKRASFTRTSLQAMRIIILYRLWLQYTLVLRDRYEYLYYSMRVFVTLHFSSTISLTRLRKNKTVFESFYHYDLYVCYSFFMLKSYSQCASLR